MKTDPVVIVSAARTPMGGFQGELKSFAAPQLGGTQSQHRALDGSQSLETPVGGHVGQSRVYGATLSGHGAHQCARDSALIRGHLHVVPDLVGHAH